MKKIFFIINCFSKGGGAEALLTSIVNHLNPQKYEIGIMEIIHDEIKKEPINKNVKMFPYYVKADAPDRKSRMYFVYHEWDKVINEYIPDDYDVYISFNYLKPSFLLPKGKKNIAWIHGDVYNLLEDNKMEERELQREAFKKANKIVAVSDETKQSLMDLFPEYSDKLLVIYNGIDVNAVRMKAIEDVDIQLKHPAILAVGRLDENKNPLRILKIFEQVYDKNPSAHLYYLGYGVLETDIKKNIYGKKIAEHVHLLGYYDNPFPIMAQCDAIGMFSHSEGFPMSLLEGVALDKPFVSSVIGGARTLANNQTCGKIIETDEEAVEAILEILQTDKELLSACCRESVTKFDLPSFIHQIEELFDKILEE